MNRCRDDKNKTAKGMLNLALGEKVCFGSLAAGPYLRPPTSVFAHKGDVPADEIIDLVVSTGGQKRHST